MKETANEVMVSGLTVNNRVDFEYCWEFFFFFFRYSSDTNECEMYRNKCCTDVKLCHVYKVIQKIQVSTGNEGTMCVRCNR